HLLAIGGDAAVPIDVPTLAGWVVVPEVHPGTGHAMGEVRVDDPCAGREDVRAAGLDGEIDRYLGMRQGEGRPVDRDRGDTQRGDYVAVDITYHRAGRQHHLQPGNRRGGDCGLPDGGRWEMHHMLGVQGGQPDREREHRGLTCGDLHADVV